MVIEITKTALKQLSNYQSVVQKEHQAAEKLQWQDMTLAVLQAAEATRARARHVSAVVAYARYLHRIQNGQERTRDIYGEPLLSKALAEEMAGLLIKSKPVAEVRADEAASGHQNVPR